MSFLESRSKHGYGQLEGYKIPSLLASGYAIPQLHFVTRSLTVTWSPMLMDAPWYRNVRIHMNIF